MFWIEYSCCLFSLKFQGIMCFFNSSNDDMRNMIDPAFDQCDVDYDVNRTLNKRPLDFHNILHSS